MTSRDDRSSATSDRRYRVVEFEAPARDEPIPLTVGSVGFRTLDVLRRRYGSDPLRFYAAVAIAGCPYLADVASGLADEGEIAVDVLLRPNNLPEGLIVQIADAVLAASRIEPPRRGVGTWLAMPDVRRSSCRAPVAGRVGARRGCARARGRRSRPGRRTGARSARGSDAGDSGGPGEAGHHRGRARAVGA